MGGTLVTDNVFVVRTPGLFSFDLDKRMTSDSQCNYFLEVEKRMLRVEKRSDTSKVS